MTTPVESALETSLMTQRRFKPPARLASGEAPRGVEREYMTKMLFFPRTAKQILNQLLIPRLPELQAAAGLTADSIKADTFDEDLERIMQVARGGFEELTGRERVFTPEEMAEKVTPKQKQQTIKQFKQLLGVDILLDDSNLQNIINPFITENVGLIKSIGDRYFDEVEGVVLRGFRSGQRADSIAQQIIERTGVAESRARLIGRDQMNKLWGDLARHRQTQAGVNKYKWRTSKDERVRGNPAGLYPKAIPSHWAREGKVFSWSKPPSDGHPGQAINCRCWAEPMVDDVLAGLEKKANATLGKESSRKKRPTQSETIADKIRAALSSGNKEEAEKIYNAFVNREAKTERTSTIRFRKLRELGIFQRGSEIILE